MSSIQPRVAAAATALLAGLGLSGATATAAPAAVSLITVHCNDAGNLQSALAAVKAGGTVKVSGVCTGNFSVTKNVTIEGSPSATLDGGGSGIVLDIAPSLTLQVAHVAIEDGYSSGGSGIFVGDSTHLRLSSVTVSHNLSYGGGAGVSTDDNAVLTAVHSHFSFNKSALTNNTPVALRGAAISAAGNVILEHSTVTDNSVTATSSNSSALGGAVFAAAKLDITDSTFARNVVQGTDAEGGSIWTAAGPSMRIVDSTFTDDKAIAVDPANEQTATGGSIYSMETTNTLQRVRITGSRAEVNGAPGGQALGGGALLAYPAHISGSVFKDNVARGATTGSNSEIVAQGGGLLLEPSATATISRTTFAGNSASASSTQGNAYADGGAIFGYGTLGVTSSTISRNKVTASSGVMALANGGGVMATSQVHATTVSNSTIADNSSTATLSKGAGSTATTTGSGGGVQDESESLSFRYDTIAGNSAHATSGGQGGGVALTPGFGIPKPKTVATIWSGNQAKIGPQCDGGFTSSGWNLFGSLSHCPTTKKSSDHTSGHADLAPLASNGGPTRTMALKVGSAALDRIPRATCRAVVKADQRGVARPQGAAKKATHRRCDIGAFERKVHH